MAFKEVVNFFRWLFATEEPKPSAEIAELKAQMAHFEDLLLARKQTFASEKTNEVSELRGIIENLEANLVSQKKELSTQIETLEADLVSQKQKLEQENEDRILDLKLRHEGRIDSIIDQYEGPKPKANGCECHDRSCCVAGRCTRPVRYRAADKQGFCGMCFAKRNGKEFVDLNPIRPIQFRRTAATIPAASITSPERSTKRSVTKDRFHNHE